MDDEVAYSINEIIRYICNSRDVTDEAVYETAKYFPDITAYDELTKENINDLQVIISDSYDEEKADFIENPSLSHMFIHILRIKEEV